MSFRDRWATVFLAPLTLPTCGCLSLGGRTTHVHDNPGTLQRISALEQRVSTLEQALRLTMPESDISAAP